MSTDNKYLLPQPPEPVPPQPPLHPKEGRRANIAILFSAAAAIFTGWYAWDTHQIRFETQKAAKGQLDLANAALDEARATRIHGEEEAARLRNQAKEAAINQAKDAERSRKASEQSAQAATLLARAAGENLKMQQAQLKLSALPRITISFYYNNDGAGYMFGGTGIGHAILKTFEVAVDGKFQPDWVSMLHAVGYSELPTFSFTVPRPTQILEHESYHKIFWISDKSAADEFALTKRSRISLKACYCSIYDDCWISTGVDAQPVKACPVPVVSFDSPPFVPPARK